MDIELIINTNETDALDRLRHAVARIRGRWHAVEARITFEPGDASRFAREATERGADLVISAGGDGTLNEVLNGILPEEGPPGADSLPRVGIVPLGTGNDFAAFLGLPTEIDEALAFAIDGPELYADLGILNERYFANVSIGGLAAEATEDASDRAKRLLGPAAYLMTGARTFVAPSPSQGRFVSDDELLFDGEFLFYAVGNGARAGGGNWITPKADLTDGMLDVCIVPDMGRTEFLRLLPDLRRGHHTTGEHVIYHQARWLTIEPRMSLTVNVDGEVVDGTGLDYRVAPRAIRVAAAAPSVPRVESDESAS